MTALEHFTEYLAQAHDCPVVLSVADTAEACVLPVLQHDTRTCRVMRSLAEARRAMEGRSAANRLLTCRLRSQQIASGLHHQFVELRRLLQHAKAALVSMEISEVLPDVSAVSAAAKTFDLRFAFLGRIGACGSMIGIAHGDAHLRPAARPPASFRVLAIVPAYNEADIIVQSIRYLNDEGLDVYVIDNWSNDGTYERAARLLGCGLSGIERFPAAGPVNTYNLVDILKRVEEIGRQPWADWIVLHDVDERRRAPWPGVSLRDAFWQVDQAGYSCVDHVTLNFRPVDNSFDPDTGDLEESFAYFGFSDHPGHFHQRRAWKRQDGRVELARSAGHDVTFPGRRVFPYKFLLKHYPVRSEAHGRRKVLCERAARWNPEERSRGWHRQYDGKDEQRFVYDPASLIRFDPDKFRNDYLVERLSGAGIFREPPVWATPPRW